MLNESEIYLSIKKWLKENEWVILGGEPPGGTNDIPLLELKDIDYMGKGSKGSKKIDVISYQNGFFLLLELKSRFSYSDVRKLNEIVGDKNWRLAFIMALREKRVFENSGITLPSESLYIDTTRYYIKSVGFNYTGKVGPRDFVTFLVSRDKVEVVLGTRISGEVRQIFST